MTNKRKTLLQGKDNYYVNIDKNIFKNLTRRQVAFVCLVEKLNKANLVATNKEIAEYLGTTKTYVHRMIKNINEKLSGLLIVRNDLKVNHLGKIVKDDYEYGRKVRTIHLSRPLHIKDNEYINIDTNIVSKKSLFLSGNELSVLKHIKSMPSGSFKGLLRNISTKLVLSLGIIKRALVRLVKLDILRKTFNHQKHKLKNSYYTINSISFNSN